MNDTAFGLSDSFPKIRPQGWSITMIPDSLGKTWSAHSVPTFDNPIPDTTTLSDFMAMPSNGASCSLQVFDSTVPIINYNELPFIRKHPLNLIFTSPNYSSFDTVIFSTRMQHGSIDSVISYALPVTWEAFEDVAQGSSQRLDYALPNPFTNELTVGFTLNQSEDVKLSLFDVTGRELLSEEQFFDVGNRELTCDTHPLQAGIYFYVLRGAEWNRSGEVVKMP